MQSLSPALMASTSEVLVAAASTWMGYLTRLAAAAQQATGATQAPSGSAADEPHTTMASPNPTATTAVPLPSQEEVAALVSCGLGPALVATVRQQLQAALEAHAVPAFWTAMSRCRTAAAAGDDDALEQHLLAGMQGLCAVVDEHCAGLQALGALVTSAVLQGCNAAAPSQGTTDTTTAPAAAPAAATTEPSHTSTYSEQALALLPMVVRLTEQYRTAVSALLMATADIRVTELLLLYYSSKLTQLAQTLAPLEQLLEAQEEGGGGGVGVLTPGYRGSGGSGGLLGGIGGPLGGGGGGGRRVSEGGGSGVGSAAVEGVAMLMGSAAGPSPAPDADAENTPPAALQLQPPAVTAAMGPCWVRRLVGVSGCLSRLSLGPAGEEAVVAAVSHHVERLLRRLALGVFDREVLPAATRAAGRIPLEFLRLVIAGDTSTSIATPAPAPLFTTTTTSTTTAPEGSAPLHPPPHPPGGNSRNIKSTNNGGGLAEPGTEARTLSEWRLRLSYLVFETLGRLRLRQMFDIVVDYPDSLPAIRDLATCLRHTNLQAQFVCSFRSALQQRLLHAGASATGIIHQYVATIRTMREIDPSGSLLQAVAQPIRDYLRGRSDTIKCLVGLVTQDGGGPNGESLLEELQAAAAAGPAVAAPMDVDAATEDADERVLRIATATAAAGFPGVAPQPPLTGAPGSLSPGVGVGLGVVPGGGPSSSSTADVVGMLTGVFGSPELFINEYRNLLCGQLLYRSDYETVREVRTLELLKMRFGETAMHACDVMLKDIADSKRINHRVHAMSVSETTPRPTSPTSAAAAAAAAAAATPRPNSPAQQGQGTPPGRGTRGAQRTPPPAPHRQTRAAAAAAAAAAAQQQQQAAAGGGGQGAGSGNGGGNGNGNGSTAAIKVPPPPEFDLLSASIISYLFWPRQEDRDKGAPDDPATGLQLPPEVLAAMATYEQRYHHLKAPRKLRWRPHMGAVDLDVSAGGVSASFRVSPLLATLLLSFKDKTALTAVELSAAVGLPPALVRRKMLFWVNHGVVLEGRAHANSGSGGADRPAAGSGSAPLGTASTTVAAAGAAAAAGGSAPRPPPLGDLVYRRVEVLPTELQGATLTDYGAEDEAPAQLPSAADRAVEEVGPFENYIKGMLQNYGGLPLDRLNHMLRLFVVSTPRYDKTPEQLQAFLQVLIARDVVLLDNNNIYRLVTGGSSSQRGSAR